MLRDDTDKDGILQQEIRKQLGSAATRRFARSLPAFRVEDAMPDRLTNLLAELDRAIRESRPGDRPRT